MLQGRFCWQTLSLSSDQPPARTENQVQPRGEGQHEPELGTQDQSEVSGQLQDSDLFADDLLPCILVLCGASWLHIHDPNWIFPLCCNNDFFLRRMETT